MKISRLKHNTAAQMYHTLITENV